MGNNLIFKNVVVLDDLKHVLKKVIFRGLYDKNGNNLNPYKKAKISIATVYPSRNICESPQIKIGNKLKTLFSPQPTIYQNQTEIIGIVDDFLKKQKIDITKLKNAIEYTWEGRGDFHMLPPIIEKHCYYLKNGFFDLDKLCRRFNNTYVKDARGNLHHLAKRFLNDFYIDEVSKMDYLDIFNSNASLINYGLDFNDRYEFYIVCDGMHRIDYVIEKLNKPISVFLIEPNGDDLIPYYAFPVPFHPTIRLSSKRAEKMFSKLERDKIHLFNDFINKVLHYDWSEAGLNVSKLRSNKEIY